MTVRVERANHSAYDCSYRNRPLRLRALGSVLPPLAFPFHREVNLCEFKSSGMNLRGEQLVNKERNLDRKLRHLRVED